VEAAKHLLESGTRSFGEISAAVGYEDVPFFRSLFQRRTGVSPTSWRRRFSRPEGGTASGPARRAS